MIQTELFSFLPPITLLTLGAHAQRGLQQLSCVSVCLSVCLLLLTDLPLYMPKGIMYTQLMRASRSSVDAIWHQLQLLRMPMLMTLEPIRTFCVVFPPCFLFVSSFESGLRDKVRLPGKC